MILAALTKPSQRAAFRTRSGFTLIELMITVTIIGILAAIAFPSYQSQARKTKRTEAKSALAELAVRQEKYYSQCYVYSSNLTAAFPVNNTSCGTSAGLGASSADTAEKLYTVSVTVGDPATTFVLKATAKSGTSQVNDTDCTELTLTSAGAKGPSGCW